MPCMNVLVKIVCHIFNIGNVYLPYSMERHSVDYQLWFCLSGGENLWCFYIVKNNIFQKLNQTTQAEATPPLLIMNCWMKEVKMFAKNKH